MSVEKAIAVVERTRQPQLGVMVMDYVNEERDGSTRVGAQTLRGDGVRPPSHRCHLQV